MNFSGMQIKGIINVCPEELRRHARNDNAVLLTPMQASEAGDGLADLNFILEKHAKQVDEIYTLRCELKRAKGQLFRSSVAEVGYRAVVVILCLLILASVWLL